MKKRKENKINLFFVKRQEKNFKFFQSSSFYTQINYFRYYYICNKNKQNLFKNHSCKQFYNIKKLLFNNYFEILFQLN